MIAVPFVKAKISAAGTQQGGLTASVLYDHPRSALRLPALQPRGRDFFNEGYRDERFVPVDYRRLWKQASPSDVAHLRRLALDGKP